ncbi:uncharacterized protein [Spinacia oleracea]|uniref:DUF4218 domain-containing protein n=1 Tax=Spinacia oleracea TaxID=3562 RepID=A0ABM3RIC9_SPIOL|nr:uncharacterized protein LOC130469870 [Spinacia oleracea]
MDKSWIDLPTGHREYIDGCMEFIEFAKQDLVEGKIRCPCKNWDTFQRMFESDGGITSEGSLDNQSGFVGRDNMGGLLRSAFSVNMPPNFPNLEAREDDELIEEPVAYDTGVEYDYSTIEEDVTYKKLLEASEEKLYEGCINFSKLSFLLHLFHLKCMNHWSIESFNMLLKLILDAFPQILDFPFSYYYSKKMIKDSGLGYEKIDACPNNCMLYWGEFLEKDKCHVCGTSRWTKTKDRGGVVSDQGTDTCKKGVPAKVMRYFPLIPRPKRIYMSSETAEDMRWHDTKRLGEDDKRILRHPSDGLAWKAFDERHKDFALDPRSVRLGLASDGFNPYRLMNTTYSTWLMMLIPYNLPPWLCMKPSSFILSTLIPGKSSPGNDIDVYLQPLVHELKLLWTRVEAFDACAGEKFNLRAALLWTINDFPGYAMLSGLSTKGYNACPICLDSTPSDRFGSKIYYCSYRKWLLADHPYRCQGAKFCEKFGTNEWGKAPSRPSGTDILRQQEKLKHVYGKSKAPPKKRQREHDDDDDVQDESDFGTKRSILFDLVYWEHNLLRHNLDVMHIEKNVSENILGTLLSMDKSRDSKNDREALEAWRIKSHLWLSTNPNGSECMTPASYSMSTEEKERFLNILQKIKVPDGYGSNLSSCVNMKQRKLINLKSHENHVLMQDILPVALRASKATKVIDLLARLSSFFKKLCSTTIDPDDLDGLQYGISLTLCDLEKEFLPSFFTIMVHLLIHLVEEVKHGGPVQYRWMYPIERHLSHLKSHGTNKAQPEGSIAEGFLLEETIRFCSRYLQGVKTIFNIPKRMDDDIPNPNDYLFNSGGRVIGKEVSIRLDDKSLKQAHRYILLHSDEIKGDLDEFLTEKRLMNLQNPVTESDESNWIINQFGGWMQNKVHCIDATNEDGKLRKALAGGLHSYGRKLKGYIINGYKFLSTDRDCRLLTQNSGIMVEADGEAYYGKVKDIYELDYYGDYKVVFFRCHWIDIHRGVRAYPNGGVCVNFSKLMHSGRLLQDDPFVSSSQAKKVFYVEDEIQKGWLHVVKNKPREVFDLGDSLPLQTVVGWRGWDGLQRVEVSGDGGLSVRQVVLDMVMTKRTLVAIDEGSSIAASKSPKSSDPSTQNWGPFSPPTLGVSQTFGTVSQPIKQPVAAKKPWLHHNHPCLGLLPWFQSHN